MIEAKKIAVFKHIKLFTLVILGIIWCLSACKKTWYCSGTQYNITAIRGNDTIFNQIGTVTGYIYTYNTAYADSIVNYYKNNGYNVIIETSAGISQKVNNDKSRVKALEDDGLICTD